VPARDAARGRGHARGSVETVERCAVRERPQEGLAATDPFRLVARIESLVDHAAQQLRQLSGELRTLVDGHRVAQDLQVAAQRPPGLLRTGPAQRALEVGHPLLGPLDRPLNRINRPARRHGFLGSR
jgi:hypothetical protein